MIRRLAPGLVGALALALLACSTPAAAPAKPTGSAPAAPAAGGAATSAPAANATAGSAPAASAPTAVPARRKIEYGLVNFSAFYWPIYVGLDKGFFDREALDVETTETRSGSDGLSALAGGSLDVITTNSEVVVLAQMRGADAIGIAGFNNKASYSLMVQPEIQRITDLKGKTLGASALRTGEVVFMKALLRKYGLTESDYSLVVAGASRNRVTAMSTKQIDGTIMPPPDNYRLEDMGLKRLAEVNEAVPEYQFQFLAAMRNWAQNNQDATVRFLRAYVNSLHWLYDPANKAQAMGVLQDRMQLSEDYARRTYEQWIEQEQFFPHDGEAPAGGLKAMEDMLVETGEATQPLPSRDKYLDFKYLEMARAQ
ncbi:MAG TPA: ABC transporter substrate-binding protein [Chloroflexota bacterium]|nr:ABC transporter substrate-binding protein [Chloroflexota bacterium]